MKIFYSLIIIVLTGLVASWFVAGELVSPAPARILKPDTNLPIDPLEFISDSGATISGWHVKHTDSKGVVLLFHGIRSNRLSMFKRAELLYSHGYSSILIDFQAHGLSSGQKITVGYLEKLDVLATVKFARSHYGNSFIAVMGVSMGGAAALLASPLSVDAMVIESVYPDIESAVHNRVKQRLGFLSWVPSKLLLFQLEPRLGIKLSDLRPIDSLDNVDSPILIISGEADLHTTKEETLQIFERAKEPKSLWIVKELAHEDVYSQYPEEYESKVMGFLNSHLGRR